MLIKLAFVMQKLKTCLKNFFAMINKDWGDTAVMREAYSTWEIPQSPPPTRETLKTMRNQSRAPAYGCVIISLLASTVSGDQCLHVEYNRLSFLFSSIFVLKDSRLANFLLTSEFSRDTKL